MTLTLNNCTFAGAHTGDGAFHPIAVRCARELITSRATNTYFYTGPSNIDNINIAATAIRVQSSDGGEGYTQVTDANGSTCYYHSYAPDSLSIDYDVEKDQPGYYYRNMERGKDQQITLDTNTPAVRIFDVGGKVHDTMGNYTSKLTVNVPEGKVAVVSGRVTGLDTQYSKLYIDDGRALRYFTFDRKTNVIDIPLATMSDNEVVIFMEEDDWEDVDVFEGYEILVTYQDREVLNINDADDWNTIATALKSGTIYAGKTLSLQADIAVSSMMGDSSHPFTANFEGNGHLITATISGSAGCEALFPYAATLIHNLRVAGSFVVGQHGAALIGKSVGNSTIDDVAITASVSMHGDVALGNSKGCKV